MFLVQEAALCYDHGDARFQPRRPIGQSLGGRVAEKGKYWYGVWLCDRGPALAQPGNLGAGEGAKRGEQTLGGGVKDVADAWDGVMARKRLGGDDNVL